MTKSTNFLFPLYDVMILFLLIYVPVLCLLCTNFVGLLQGSSKTGFLGEATINFADYAESVKPLSLSLPLKATNSGAVLHVSVFNLAIQKC